MMTLDSHFVILALMTLAAGWLMTVAGVHKRALEWRRRRRVCPSCGRLIQARVCAHCGSA